MNFTVGWCMLVSFYASCYCSESLHTAFQLDSVINGTFPLNRSAVTSRTLHVWLLRAFSAPCLDGELPVRPSRPGLHEAFYCPTSGQSLAPVSPSLTPHNWGYL